MRNDLQRTKIHQLCDHYRHVRRPSMLECTGDRVLVLGVGEPQLPAAVAPEPDQAPRRQPHRGVVPPEVAYTALNSVDLRFLEFDGQDNDVWLVIFCL